MDFTSLQIKGFDCIPLTTSMAIPFDIKRMKIKKRKQLIRTAGLAISFWEGCTTTLNKIDDPL